MTEHLAATSPTRQFAPLAIILGIPLLFAAIFFYTTPIMLATGGEQGVFKCGSPSAPNSEAKNVCQEPESVGKNKALYSGLSGLALIGVGAVWMFRGQREDEDEWEEDAPRSRRDDDIDLRVGDRESGALRGPDRPRDREAERSPSRAVDDVAPDVDVDDADGQDGTRASRRSSGKRRSVLRDDDFGESSPPRRKGDGRKDDDWDSDGWR